MTDGITAELARKTAGRKRHARAKTVIFVKICRGLYISHAHDMGLSHEPVWNKHEGRKWVLSWKVTSFAGLFEGNKVTKKFDTMQEARAFANALVKG
jgi:hypothetical protein